jgi:AbrB family looped-hinge helix DNA binding protein
MKSIVSSKGQITLPASVRLKMGLTVGTPVRFEFREEGVLLRKGDAAAHPVDRVFGRLTLRLPVDALLDAMRGPRLAAQSRRGSRPRRARRR